MGRVAGLIYRHGWSLVALAAGLYFASLVHEKPSWADPDFRLDGGLALVRSIGAATAVLVVTVALALARRTRRIVEAAAVLVGTFVLAGVALAATDPTPVTGTATMDGLPGRPALVSGPAECMGPSGRVTRIDALREWKIVVLGPDDDPTGPLQMWVEVSVGDGFTSLEGQLQTQQLADAWVRGRAVLSYELAAAPGILTFTWDCGHAPVLSPVTSLLWWIAGDGLLPGFIVVVALLTFAAGLEWPRRRRGAEKARSNSSSAQPGDENLV